MRWVNKKEYSWMPNQSNQGQRGKSYFAPCRKQWKSGLRWVEGITETKEIELDLPAYEGLWRSERDLHDLLCVSDGEYI